MIHRVIKNALGANSRARTSSVLHSPKLSMSYIQPGAAYNYANVASRPIQRRYLSSSSSCQSGHNKWSKIRHNKAIQDSKKNLLYNKLARDIEIAVRAGGSPNPALNPALTLAMKKAKSQGLPKANLERALIRASAGPDSSGQDAYYEIMTNNRVGVIVHCVTDNPNRTKGILNKIVKDNEARFTPTAFLFSKKAIVLLNVPTAEEFERLWEIAIELGAEDIINLAEDEEGAKAANADASEIEVEIVAPPDLLTALTNTLSQPPHSYNITESEIQWRPSDPEAAQAEAEALTDEGRENLRALVAEIEESPDCIGVWTSVD